MKYLGICGVLLITFWSSLACAQDEEGGVYNSLAEAVKGMQADAYEERERASLYLWQEASVRELEPFLKHESPEVRYRVKAVQKYLLSGLVPDTPEEVKMLVSEFQEASPRRQLVIIEKLSELEAYYPIFAVYHSLKDEEGKEKLNGKLSQVLERGVQHFLKANDVKMALTLIDLAQPNEGNARMWASVVHYHGDAKAELKSLNAQAQLNSYDELKFLALFRAEGMMEEALRLAEETESAGFVASTAFAQGDFLTYFDWWKAEYESLKFNEDFLKAYRLRIEGKWQALEEYYPVLVDGATVGKRGKHRAILHLLALGKNESAFALGSTQEKRIMMHYLISRDQYEEVFNLYGLKLGEKPSEEWIKENVDNREREWWFSSSSKQLDKLASVYLSLNDREAIFAMLRPLWENIDDEDARFDFITLLANKDGGIYNSFAAELAVDFLEGEEARYRKSLLAGHDEANYLWEVSEEVLPDLTFPERISLVRCGSVTSHIDGQAQLEQVQVLLEFLKKDCVENPEDKGKRMHLFKCLEHLGFHEESLEFRRLFFSEDESWKNKSDLISKLAFLDKREEAAVLAQSLDNSEQRREFIFNLYKASVMLDGGMTEEAEELIEGYLKMILDKPHSLFEGSGLFSKGRGDEQALRIVERGLRVVSPEEQSGLHWMKLVERASKLYQRAGEYHLSAMCGEALILHTVKKLYSSRSFLLGAVGVRSLNVIAEERYRTDLMWAKHYALKGKDEARAKKVIQQLTTEWDANGSLADDLYPFLREVSYVGLLKKSVDSGVSRIESNLRFYPEADGLKNTLAWLAARAVMHLPKAQKYVEEALNATPRSAPYLDTTAEVYFALGNREKALQFSKRAWQDALNSYMHMDNIQMIKDQYYYFRDSPIPTEENE